MSAELPPDPAKHRSSLRGVAGVPAGICGATGGDLRCSGVRRGDQTPHVPGRNTAKHRETPPNTAKHRNPATSPLKPRKFPAIPRITTLNPAGF